MKVILTQDVRGQGKRGQMIEVSDGYARNFLLPRKLAQEATADNVNTMKMNDKAAQERQAKERAEALEIRNRMKDMTVVVTAKGGGAGLVMATLLIMTPTVFFSMQRLFDWGDKAYLWFRRKLNKPVEP